MPPPAAQAADTVAEVHPVGPARAPHGPVVHREDHHPDLLVQYNRCGVAFNTHSAGGITRNDFVCAAKADAVYAQGVAR